MVARLQFFWNRLIKNEERIMIPSPRIPTYDLQPEMSADEVCSKVLENIKKQDVLIINFANGDMVGHTGNLQAIIEAVEVVDDCTKKITEATLAVGGSLVITADHGNAERTWSVETTSPDTAHTTYDVPLHIVGEKWKNNKLRHGGILADIAPTLLTFLDIAKPAEMHGTSLV